MRLSIGDGPRGPAPQSADAELRAWAPAGDPAPLLGRRLRDKGLRYVAWPELTKRAPPVNWV